jgi:hypothetical protein
MLGVDPALAAAEPGVHALLFELLDDLVHLVPLIPRSGQLDAMSIRPSSARCGIRR